MKRLTLMAAVALLTALACSSQPPPPICTSGGTGFGSAGGVGGAGGDFAEAIELTDAPVSTLLSVPARFDCTGMSTEATAVNVEVLGPDNRPVEHQATAPSSATAFGATTTTVTFTPTAPGTYHLTAVFEPALGQVQKDVWVARDLRQRPISVQASGSHVQACLRLEATARGTVLCQHTGATTTLDVLHRSGAAESLPMSGLAVSGDSAWVAFGARVDQYLDMGGDQLVVAATCQVSAPVQNLLAATADSALVVFADGLWKLQASAGGCQSTLLAGVDPAAVQLFAAAWNGDRPLLVVPTVQKVSSPGVDGGLVSTLMTGLPVAAGPDGVWFQDPGQMTLVPLDGGSGQTVTLPVGWSARTDFASIVLPAAPQLVSFGTTSGFVVAPNGGDAELREFRRASKGVQTVTPNFVVLFDEASTTAAFVPRLP